MVTRECLATRAAAVETRIAELGRSYTRLITEARKTKEQLDALAGRRAELEELLALMGPADAR